jgi:hypothetical protein
MPCAQPRPTASHQPLHSDRIRIEEHRNVHCRHYSGCVDVAVRKDWESFTCARCPLMQADKAPGADAYAFNQPSDTGRP